MFDWIYDNLYVGDFDSILNQNEAKEEGITAIVRLDLASREKYKWGKDFTVLDAAFADTKSIPDGIIPKVTKFIYQQIENEETVLVHCAAGMSRSVSLAMAYLIEYESMSLAEAFVQYVKVAHKLILTKTYSSHSLNIMIYPMIRVKSSIPVLSPN